MNMPKTAVLFGAALCLVALVGAGIALSDNQNFKTALIPLAFGIPILVAGLVGAREHLRKHAMHVAAMFGVLGALGALFPIGKTLVAVAGGAPVARPTAFALQLAMAALCAVFTALCVRSFIEARVLRKAA